MDGQERETKKVGLLNDPIFTQGALAALRLGRKVVPATGGFVHELARRRYLKALLASGVPFHGRQR